MRTEAVTEATLDDVYGALEAAYAGAEDDPTTAVLCPGLQPLPHPDRATLARHLNNGMTLLVGYYPDGVSLLTLHLIDPDGRIRAAWGPVDRAGYDVGVYDPDGGIIDWCIRRFGQYRVDPGVGWITRRWFAEYMEQAGPFDVDSFDHPGLDGRLLADFDDVAWALVVTSLDPLTYHYELP